MPKKLSDVEAMIWANAQAGIDQRSSFDSFEASLDSYYENVRDTLLEMGKRSHLDESFPIYRKFVRAEAARLRIALPKNYAVDGTTADEMIAFLADCLLPDFSHMMLNFSRQHLGDEDGVYVSYNSVPHGTTGVAVLNTWATPKFSIYAGKGESWPRGETCKKVQVKMFSGGVHRGHSFRGLAVPFRAKTGTPEQVLEHLVRYFLENKDVLLPET